MPFSQKIGTLPLVNKMRILKGLAPVGITVQVSLNIGCNARCIMCDGRIYDKKARFSYRRVEKLIDFLDRKTVKAVKLLGGEPLLDKKGLLRLIRKCSRKHIEALVTTNGSLLDEDFIASAINGGLKSITLSVDALGDKHDKIRGMPGLFSRIEKAIKDIRLRSAGFAIDINTVLMKQNIYDIPRIIQWANSRRIRCLSVIVLEDFGRDNSRLKVNKRRLAELSIPGSRKVNVIFNDFKNLRIRRIGCDYLLSKININDNAMIVPCLFNSKEKFRLNLPIADLYKQDEFRKYILDKVNNCYSCFGGKI